jgi:LCP family protein required for cell wall assembly
MSRYDTVEGHSGQIEDRNAAWPGRQGYGHPPDRGRSGHRRGARILAWVSAIMTIVITGASLTAYAAYRHLLGNIHHIDVTHLLGKRPPKYNSALNILLIGSDSRTGSNARYGAGVLGSRSDTMILIHISPTHSGATLISFPRDSLVPTLECGNDGQGHTGQQAQPNQPELLNATFSFGGAPCLWKTLELLTGIRIDHFVQIDFTGFKNMVNALGGVDVCVPYSINDQASGLRLAAGAHHVMGAQALAFVRLRHIGNWSDLQRIKRQQFFMASVLQQVLKTNLLTQPGRLYSFASATTKSLTTDSGLSPGTMLTIAESMRGLHASSVSMIQVPVVDDPIDPNRVDWVQPDANKLFSSIKFDATLPKPAKTKTPAGKPAPTVNPSLVQVQVLNGSGTPNVGQQVGQLLGQRGFSVVGTGNADSFTYTDNVIEYASSSEMPAVNTLRSALSGTQLRQVTTLQPGTIDLIVGSSFNGLKAAATTATPVKDLAKQYGGISGTVNACKSNGAF